MFAKSEHSEKFVRVIKAFWPDLEDQGVELISESSLGGVIDEADVVWSIAVGSSCVKNLANGSCSQGCKSGCLWMGVSWLIYLG